MSTGIRPRRLGALTSIFRCIDDVIVQKCGRMDHFDHRSERMLVRSTVTAGVSDQQQQRGTQPLAAAGDDVVGDPADQSDVGVQRLAQDPVDGREVVAQRRLQQRDGHLMGGKGLDGWRAA